MGWSRSLNRSKLRPAPNEKWPPGKPMTLACAEHRIHWKRSERPQTRKRNHPLPSFLETSRVDGVKAPQHFKTPRSRLLAVVELRRKLSFDFVQDGDLLRG